MGDVTVLYFCLSSIVKQYIGTYCTLCTTVRKRDGVDCTHHQTCEAICESRMLVSATFSVIYEFFKKEKELSYFEPGNLRSGNDLLSNSGTSHFFKGFPSPHTPVHIGGSAILFGVNMEGP